METVAPPVAPALTRGGQRPEGERHALSVVVHRVLGRARKVNDFSVSVAANTTFAGTPE